MKEITGFNLSGPENKEGGNKIRLSGNNQESDTGAKERNYDFIKREALDFYDWLEKARQGARPEDKNTRQLISFIEGLVSVVILGKDQNYANIGLACMAFWRLHDITQEQRYYDKAVELSGWLVQDKDLDQDGKTGWGDEQENSPSWCGVIPPRTEGLWESGQPMFCLLKSYEKTGGAQYLDTAREAVDTLFGDFGITFEGNKRYTWKWDNSCAVDWHIKNTNLLFGEALFQLHEHTGQTSYQDLAQKTLNAETWELDGDNLGYFSLRNVNDPNDFDLVRRQHDRDNLLRCKPPEQGAGGSASCWTHMRVEGQSLFRLFLERGFDLIPYIETIYGEWRDSPFGPEQYWQNPDKASPTAVTSFPCFLRSLGEPYLGDCRYSLDRYTGTSAEVLWSLVHEPVF